METERDVVLNEETENYRRDKVPRLRDGRRRGRWRGQKAVQSALDGHDPGGRDMRPVHE